MSGRRPGPAPASERDAAPEPRANPHLDGHGEAERVLAAAAASGRLHHAWLIAGPAGIGKATLAFRFARALLAGFPDGDLALDPRHPVFRRVAAGAHPDLAVLAPEWDDKRERFRTEIGVAPVRAIGDFLALTPAEGGWRVVIVDGVDLLNRNAANALLKLLEEPPARAVLLLTAAAPGRLLPTVRSRCRLLRLAPLGDTDARRVLGRCGLDGDALDRAVRVGAGAPGRALRLATDGAAALLARAERALAVGDEAADDECAELVVRTENGLAVFGAALRAALERRARAAAQAGDRSKAAASATASFAVGSALDEAVRFNLDARQAILGALRSVRHA